MCGSWISSVSIVSDYGLDDRAIGVKFPAGAKDFSSILCVQTGSGAHPASCTGGPFPRAKARPGRDADHSPTSSSEVKNEYEIYLLPPSASVPYSGSALAGTKFRNTRSSGMVYRHILPHVRCIPKQPSVKGTVGVCCIPSAHRYETRERPGREVFRCISRLQAYAPRGRQSAADGVTQRKLSQLQQERGQSEHARSPQVIKHACHNYKRWNSDFRLIFIPDISGVSEVKDEV
jgi:hypothetical protein